MKDWRNITIEGIGSIEKVVAEFNVWPDHRLSISKFKVKIREKKSGSFFGTANVAVKSQIDGEPDWISGSGDTVAEALEDTVRNFLSTLDGFSELLEDDFIWADLYDF
ncbi:hypothetical protein CDO73_02550 [Saccharibacillus sp. O23]|uniref:hypothetical protein n=1 Tax=Saccharibacillus sp. O23 TaxID=2009338 RepID=UPI000B4E2A62|nr:hypothetical protein [Saccharibacillus sp. O23]OWR32502.1 hypothetical protein CDO73_02550 [Saccharibacillus sp. O23]